MENNTVKNLLSRCLALVLAFVLCGVARAQEWFWVHSTQDGAEWTFPYRIAHFPYFDFTEDGETLRAYRLGADADGADGLYLPFSVATLDSLTFGDRTGLLTEDHYRVFTMNIETEERAPVVSKDTYVNCYVSVNGQGEFPDYSGSARIRGRGNSTWLWYDKKPYRIKLDAKSKMLGLKSNKDWVLLANYRDPTMLMNTFAFETARWLGMPYTNNTRYVEVFLNGDYIGVYQLTEQVEQGGSRVDVSDTEGILLSFDLDDGPGLSPGATDNFYSKVYKMPMCVKYPDDPTAEQLDYIREELGVLEDAIKRRDYEAVDSLMDLKSYMNMLQLQEYLYNVDFTAPRSVYMFRDAGGKFTMGPVWDWDAGYDFDWNNMEHSHNFFGSYTKLMMGTSPYHQNGYYSMPNFFTDMFASPRFVAEYKEAWNAVADSIFERNWEETGKYVANLKKGAYVRNTSKWPIGKSPAAELNKMRAWLSNRAEFMTGVINDYPELDIPQPTEIQVVGSMSVNLTLSYRGGYHQDVSVDVSSKDLASLFGVEESRLSLYEGLTIVPLYTDGTEGENHTNGMFGGWFDVANDPQTWNTGHVFIEVMDDLFSWDCGLRAERGFCEIGHTHTVTMQYRLPVDGVTKAVNVAVTMEIQY